MKNGYVKRLLAFGFFVVNAETVMGTKAAEEGMHTKLSNRHQINCKKNSKVVMCTMK